MNSHKTTCMTVVYEAQDQALQATWLHDQDVYRRVWPKHCTSCKGWGQFMDTYDPSPAGVSLSAGTLTDVSECMSCLADEICPRCAGPAPFGEAEEACVCTRCGFVEGKTEGIADPPQPAECDC